MSKFRINLQLFTGEKTEKAIPKRRREAREKGQVNQSKEINSALVLIFVFAAINFINKYYCLNMLSRQRGKNLFYISKHIKGQEFKSNLFQAASR